MSEFPEIETDIPIPGTLGSPEYYRKAAAQVYSCIKRAQEAPVWEREDAFANLEIAFAWEQEARESCFSKIALRMAASLHRSHVEGQGLVFVDEN